MSIYRGVGGSVDTVDQVDAVVASVGQGGTGAATVAGAKINLGIPTNIDDLADVAVGSPTLNQVLQYNGATWTNATAAGIGTVTQVEMTVPTGLSVAGSPITGVGTLAVTYASGYSIPTTAKQGQWDTAYGWGNHASVGYLTSSSTLDASKLSNTIDGGTY